MSLDHVEETIQRCAFGSKAIRSSSVVSLTLLAVTSVWTEGRHVVFWSLNARYSSVKHLL